MVVIIICMSLLRLPYLEIIIRLTWNIITTKIKKKKFMMGKADL
jgi:hypothetical protein